MNKKSKMIVERVINLIGEHTRTMPKSDYAEACAIIIEHLTCSRDAINEDIESEEGGQ